MGSNNCKSLKGGKCECFPRDKAAELPDSPLDNETGGMTDKIYWIQMCGHGDWITIYRNTSEAKAVEEFKKEMKFAGKKRFLEVETKTKVRGLKLK